MYGVMRKDKIRNEYIRKKKDKAMLLFETVWVFLLEVRTSSCTMIKGSLIHGTRRLYGPIKTLDVLKEEMWDSVTKSMALNRVGCTSNKGCCN